MNLLSCSSKIRHLRGLAGSSAMGTPRTKIKVASCPRFYWNPWKELFSMPMQVLGQIPFLTATFPCWLSSQAPFGSPRAACIAHQAVPSIFKVQLCVWFFLRTLTLPIAPFFTSSHGPSYWPALLLLPWPLLLSCSSAPTMALPTELLFCFYHGPSYWPALCL